MKYTIEDIKEAAKTSTSYSQVIQKIGLIPAGGNYATVKRKIRENCIDISHFKGRAWNKGVTLPPRRTIEDYLSNKVRIKSYSLKNRLLREGIFKRKCSNCNLETWLKNPIPLELDHIDGNSEDNSLNNLRLLCPNCHALTPTYRGKNKGKGSGLGGTRTRMA